MPIFEAFFTFIDDPTNLRVVNEHKIIFFKLQTNLIAQKFSSLHGLPILNNHVRMVFCLLEGSLRHRCFPFPL